MKHPRPKAGRSPIRGYPLSAPWGGNELLIGPAEVGGGDAQFLAVFGDGSAGQFDFLFRQKVDDFLITERLGRVFLSDDRSNAFLHTGVGNGIAVLTRIARGEKILEGESAMRGSQKLVGDCPGNRGLVNFDGFRDLGHGHGPKLGTPFLEEISLPVEDSPSDPFDGVLSLVDGIDQKLTCSHLITDVFLFLGREGSLADQFLVGFIDFEARDIVVVQTDDPFSAHPFDDRIGGYRQVVVLREPPSRSGSSSAIFSKA